MEKMGKDPDARHQPNRRKRRRPKNMLQAHVRRQLKHRWLETHVWHAKRMHMRNLWGFRLVRAASLHLVLTLSCTVDNRLSFRMTRVCARHSAPRSICAPSLTLRSSLASSCVARKQRCAACSAGSAIRMSKPSKRSRALALALVLIASLAWSQTHAAWSRGDDSAAPSRSLPAWRHRSRQLPLAAALETRCACLDCGERIECNRDWDGSCWRCENCCWFCCCWLDTSVSAAAIAASAKSSAVEASAERAAARAAATARRASVVAVDSSRCLRRNACRAANMRCRTKW